MQISYTVVKAEEMSVDCSLGVLVGLSWLLNILETLSHLRQEINMALYTCSNFI